MSSNIANYKKGHVQAIPFPTDPSGNYPLLKGDLCYLHPTAISEPLTAGTGGIGGPQAGQGIAGITLNSFLNAALSVKPVRNASNIPSFASYVDMQQAFAYYFAGVAMRKTGQQPGETLWQLPETIDPGYTLIATSGIFEYQCPAQVWNPGDLVGIYATHSSGSWVCNAQMVDKVQSPGAVNCAIGVAVLPFGALGQSLQPQFNNDLTNIPSNSNAISSVWVDIRPAVMYRNIQALPSGGYGYGSGE